MRIRMNDIVNRTSLWSLIAFIVVLYISLCNLAMSAVENANSFTALTTPAEEVTAIDKPNDNGSALMVTWKVMPYERKEISYQVLIAEKQEGPYHPLEKIIFPYKTKADYPQSFGFSSENKLEHAFEVKEFLVADDKAAKSSGATKAQALTAEQTYFIKVKTIDESSGSFVESAIVSTVPQNNYFAFNKLNSLLILIFLTVVLLVCIIIAQKNPERPFIRRIAGLDAMEDALGRATEMGKSALFVHGLKSVSEVSTIASINILGRIAKKIAEFDAGLKVANWDPVVQQVSQETVKEAYIEEGRPDAYKEENIFFASGDQFSYAAAVEGIMVRERPATIFYFGYFYAESLLLSETGAHTGAIQIAGSDAFTQIPFFITTCDYTLIGEELYAASAYLSREPKLLGGLKGQDIGKMVIIVVLILGTLFSTFFGWERFAQLFWPV